MTFPSDHVGQTSTMAITPTEEDIGQDGFFQNEGKDARAREGRAEFQ